MDSQMTESSGSNIDLVKETPKVKPEESQPKSPGTVRQPEVSQVQDEFSNSASLNFTDAAQNEEDPNTAIENDLNSSFEPELDQTDVELESNGENMTIYENNSELGNENFSTGDGSQTHSVPECSQASALAATQREMDAAMGLGIQNDLMASLQRVNNCIALIDSFSGREGQLLGNLPGVSSSQLPGILEQFGIAETQVEVINQILWETTEKFGKRND